MNFFDNDTMNEDNFKEGVKAVLQNWTALKLAVEHGMAGRNSLDTAVDMIDWVVELFKINENLDSSDVGLVLADEMDVRFQTLCEDNSTEEVGLLLWRLFQYWKKSDAEGMQSIVTQLPSCEPWLNKNSTRLHHHVTSENTAADSDMEDAMEEDIPPNPQQITPPQPMNEVSDGWHVVKNRKR